MERKIAFYPHSRQEAEREGEQELWRESYRGNIACAVDIEAALQGIGGGSLPEGAVKPLLDKWGFKRVNYVLANSLNRMKEAAQISPANRQWARGGCVPPDKEHNPDFAVRADPAALSSLADQAREAFEALDLFAFSHCETDSAELDYTGRVVVMSTHTLREDCWTRQNQLWYAHGGNGCKPHAIGRSILCTCLSDGEQGRLLRGDIVGVIREECLPDWAREKLLELRGPQQNEQGPSMGGMDMT